MQNQLFHNFLRDLLQSKKIAISNVAKTILRSKDFKILETAKFIELKTATNKGKYYEVIDEEKLNIHFKNLFPNEITSVFTGIQNAKSFKDSKGRKKESQRILLIRGNRKISLNGEDVDLSAYTAKFNVFAIQLNQITADKLCFVENLDCFMVAEKTLGENYTYVHSYGRISAANFKNIITDEILFCPDYDFIGLNEYINLKGIYPNTTLFLPDNYNSLFKKYAKPLKKKNGQEQQPSLQVLNSDEEIVKTIRMQLLETKHFLEQQIIFQD